ncbi:MAG: DUF357 domain-containing protein [Candidatus Aenigmarchaeota archaeon]|nr:DUF357 domain-containing protein [Candidatus Aenigmarchaeota archaeon]
MDLENNLRSEIDKWTKKIETEMKNVKVIDKKNENFLTNIRAYIKDSKYFLEKGDLVRSFEAIVWAWSWLEILKELNVVDF